jgi:phosphoglycolate phosphatase
MMAHAVFDLDGTLVDSVPLFTSILNLMLEDRGEEMRLRPDEVRPHATAGGLAMVDALLGDRCGEPQEALEAFRRRYGEIPTPQDSLYPGIREALVALRDQGVTLSLFSNKTQPLCEKVLSELGLAPLFSAIVGTAPSVPLKPDPAGLDLALARAGGLRAASCYIGDSEADHALALAAGVPLVMVAWGYGEAERDWPGATIARHAAEIPPLALAALATHAAD